MKKPSFEIRTSRLILRPLSSADYAVWRSAHMQAPKRKLKWEPEIRKERMLTLKSFTELLHLQAAARERDQTFHFGIFKKSDGSLVGMASIMDIFRGRLQSGYLGMFIFRQQAGRGFGKEGLKAVIQLGLTQLRLHRLLAAIDADNVRSIAMVEAVKMRFEGLRKGEAHDGKRWNDRVYYALTCEDLKIRFRGKKPVRKSLPIPKI